MKKAFNQTKRPADSGRKKNDWYEPLEDEYTDEDYEIEEYADEEFSGDEETDIVYSDEEYAEDATVAEAAGGEEDDYYYEESEAPVEEVPDEEMFEGEITYVEDAPAEEEYYEEEVADEDLEYVEDEYLEQEITYEDDDFYVAEFEEETPKKKKKKAAAKFSIMDAIILITGVAVLCLALFTGAAYLSNSMMQKQVSDLVNVGTQLSSINMIGEKGINAIAAAMVAKLTVVSEPEEEEVEKVDEVETGYEETDYTRQISVVMNMTSIQKDLKIKFSNENTGKLVANVPFSVTVVDPDGKSVIWSDDDMDGIIYKKDITPGTYKITMEALADSRYSNYGISTMTRTTEVKKDIAYAKVDVSNEVKTESEINATKEDTKKNETVVESSLTDTVTWVESKSSIAVYSEYAKSQIPDPLTLLENPIKKPNTAKLDTVASFQRAATTASGTVSPASAEIKVGETVTLKANVTASCDGAGEEVQSVTITDITWYSKDAAIATVDPNTGVVTGAAAGEVVVYYSATAAIDVAVTTEEEPAESTETTEPTPAPETDSVQAVTIKSYNKTVEGTATIKVVEDVVLTKGKVTVEKTEYAVALKGTQEVTATATGFTENKALTYKAVSDAEDIVKATVDEKGKITLTAGEKAGTAKITVTVNYKENGTKDTEATTTFAVTAGADVKITFEKESTTVYAEVPLVINATLENTLTKNPTVTVTSSNEGILKVAVAAVKTENNKLVAPITLTGMQEGNATLTVVVKEDALETKITYAVTVLPNPKKDKKTELTDALGNLIYVFDNNDYRQATYADYYTFDKFYVKGEEKYTGWQTIDGKVYYFTAEGKKVTGEQVIQGAKYTFASDGTLVTGTGALGIDVSKWNGTIDWNAVKNSGVNYVIIRVGYRGSTEGKLVIDPKFVTNIKGATAVGLKVGVYFFTQAVDEREAVEEASMVLEQIKNYKISYPVFLDVEPSGGRGDKIDATTRTAVCKAFCQTIQNAGYTAGIYANKNWLEEKLNSSQLSTFKIWLAQYAATPTYTGRYDLWQYRATGKVSGISGNVDMNLSYLGY